MPDAYVVSEWNEALRNSRLVVITGAGASAPYGMPPMNKFHEYCESGVRTNLQRICAPFTEAYIDLEFVLERLEFYEHQVAPELEPVGYLNKMLGLSGSGCAVSLRNAARVLRVYLNRKIIEVYGELEPAQAAHAAQLYTQLYVQLSDWCQNRPKVLPIFTTNYDLTFEAISEHKTEFQIVTGMRPRLAGLGNVWDAKVYEEDSTARFAVFRLHGCSHWFENKIDGNIWFQRFTGGDIPNLAPKILYPEPGKDDRIQEEPFSTAYSYLRKCLLSAEFVVIIGYSGRDVVIQHYIQQALDQDASKKFVVVTKRDAFPDGLAKAIPDKNRLAHLRGGIERSLVRILEALEGVLPAEAQRSLTELQAIYEEHNDESVRGRPSAQQCQCEDCEEYRARTS